MASRSTAELGIEIDPDIEIAALPWLARACESCGDDAEQWTAELDKWKRYVKRFEDADDRV